MAYPHDRGDRRRLAPAGQDVDHHVRRVDSFAQRLLAGRLDRRQPVAEHRCQDAHHLAVAIGRARQLAANTIKAGGQHPVLERRTIAQGAGLAGQYRHVMPGVEDRLVAAEASGMLANRTPVLTQLNPIGIGADLYRPPDGVRRYRVAVVVEPNEAGLRHRSGH
jgi:hypothetical protein